MVPKTCKFLALVLTMTVVILSWWIARYCHQRLPTPVDNTQHNFRFVEKNARVSLALFIVQKMIKIIQRHLVRMTNFGPRPVGSYQCDVQAVNYLETVLSHIKKKIKNTEVTMEIDNQTVSGHFDLPDWNVFQKYQNVNNIIVRLSNSSSASGNISRPAILVNCHFDSVPQGPGASDDAVR